MSGSCQYPPLADFQNFLQTVVGIDPAYLPLSPVPAVVTFVYNLCQRLVNQSLWCAGTYTPAFFNLGASLIVHLAQDPASGPKYFGPLRSRLNIGAGFKAGVVTATADDGTSVSLTVPKWAEKLTVGDLQRLEDPWGQMYLTLAQDYGPNVWELV